MSLGYSRSVHVPAAAESYTLSLHDALPISSRPPAVFAPPLPRTAIASRSSTPWHLRSSYSSRSEEHTSELQSRPHLVCRLLLAKKNRCRLTRAARTRDSNP